MKKLENEILIYQGDANLQMKVKTDGKTVWLTQESEFWAGRMLGGLLHFANRPPSILPAPAEGASVFKIRTVMSDRG